MLTQESERVVRAADAQLDDTVLEHALDVVLPHILLHVSQPLIVATQRLPQRLVVVQARFTLHLLLDVTLRVTLALSRTPRLSRNTVRIEKKTITKRVFYLSEVITKAQQQIGQPERI